MYNFRVSSDYSRMLKKGKANGIIIKVIDSGFKVSEIKYRSHNYIIFRSNIFGKVMYIFIPLGSLAYWVECSPTVRETWSQYQVLLYQRL